MLELPDDWVWDFWTASDAGLHHLFFLKAPRSLGDPDLRHRSASVGHAVSEDLVSWRRVADALGPQPAPAYDDLATWTGCVVRADRADGEEPWLMFTSGLSSVEAGNVQRIGVSTSPDLTTWSRVPDVVVQADERWYLRHTGHDHEEHWRDPWVVRDEHGTWHMYVTAQGVGDLPGPAPRPGDRPGRGRGVVGHATSADLRTWQVTEPLSDVGGRFDQLEVISVLQVDGRWVLLFSCLGPEMPGAGPGAGGIWSVAVNGPGTRVDPARAVRLTNERLYVGKVLPQPGGGGVLLAFRQADEHGAFVGGIIDPLPVVWDAAGNGLRLDLREGDPASVYAPDSPG